MPDITPANSFGNQYTTLLVATTATVALNSGGAIAAGATVVWTITSSGTVAGESFALAPRVANAIPNGIKIIKVQQLAGNVLEVTMTNTTAASITPTVTTGWNSFIIRPSIMSTVA